MRRLVAGLSLLLVALVVAYVALVVTTPEHAATRPISADEDTTYAAGSLPDGAGDAVEVAVRAMPLVLGYDYRSLDEGLDKATALMTRDFSQRFRRTFADSAAQLAEEKQAVAHATVRAAGVVRVEGGRVLALVYVDQLLVSDDTISDRDNPVQVSQNRVLVGVTNVDGTWLLDSVQPI